MTVERSGRTDELEGVGPALKLRRLAMGRVGKEVAHEASLDLKWFEHREAGTRALPAEQAEQWCAKLGTTVGAMIDEVVGLHELLPKAVGRTLYAYVCDDSGCPTTLEISPGPISGPDPEDVARTWDNLEALSGEQCENRAVREATRSEKEAWLVQSHARMVDGSVSLEELVDWPIFPNLSEGQFSALDSESTQSD